MIIIAYDPIGYNVKEEEREMLTPEPGTYENIPYDEYRAWGAVNQSLLMHMKKSAAHLKWEFDHPSETTADQETGNAIHTLILEPGAFYERYMMGIDGDGRTKEIKEARLKLEELACGRTIIKPKEMDKIIAIAKAVNDHPRAKQYIETSQRELSIIWRDPATQLLCKARIDAYDKNARICSDLKSTNDASLESFAGSISTFNYYNQSAWYRQGLIALDNPCRHNILIAIEKDPPFGVAVFRLDDEVIQLGAKENADLLRRYAHCCIKDEWPSYSTAVQDIGMRSWAIQKLEEKYAGQ